MTDRKSQFRSNFEPGSTRWAVRRAQWIAMGIDEADFHKPKIAVVNTSSKLSVCFQHLDDVAEAVSAAIREVGGLPLEIRTAASSDFVTSAGRQGRYLMPTRDLMSFDIEVQVEGAELDGMVLLSSCDKTTPAHLMAAARLNIPSLVLACGYQLGGICRGRSVDIETLYNAVGTYKAGQIDLDELTDMSRTAIRGPGVCAGLATANTMHIMAEALGMTLPGNAPIRAGSDRLFALASEAGRRIVGMIEEDLRPRDILSDGAFRNAVVVAVALGTSVNTVRHLAAIANQSVSRLDIVGEVEKAAARIPLIAEIRPNGETRIEDFDAAGGCLAAMKLLCSELDPEVRIAAGGNLGALLDRTMEPDNPHLRPLSDPFSADPGLAILRGSLAPDGAVVKVAAVPREIRRFEGKAKVFESENEAIERLAKNHPEKLQPGDVAVLRMMGPKGGPGTVFAASFMAALQGTDLRGRVAVVTDGELSGLNSGITIGQVMPEAAEGGPLAWVEDGDEIIIDLDARRVDLNVAEAIIDARASRGLSLPDAPKGWLSIYRRTVGPLSRGAVMGDRTGEE
jgi:dihydroxy-acid dehydratase